MRRGRRLWWMGMLGAFASALLSGCGLFEEVAALPTPAPLNYNIFANPSFDDEVGIVPWAAPPAPDATAGVLSERFARTGTRSAEMRLDGGPGEAGSRAVGLWQRLDRGDFPEYVSGFYRVEAWEPNSEFQYLAFIVRVVDGDFGVGERERELRFMIAGAAAEPPAAGNVRYVFLSREEPAIGEWTYFAYPVEEAIASRFGKVPETWSEISVSFEVRYEGRAADAPPAAATVYFDDVYVGLQSANPNRPPRD